MNVKCCGVVGARNNSDDSEIRFLFFSSCYPQIFNLDIYTIFQLERIRKNNFIEEVDFKFKS
jgi:hypothetical protein